MKKISVMYRRITVILLLLVSLLGGCGTEKTSSSAMADQNGDGKITCTLEVRCDTLLQHLDEMKPEKAAIVPSDGVILSETELELSDGETVFDVFRKTMREKNIHFEYVDSTVYKSTYIEGIANLYEFDCGPQSGWMYSVNAVYPGLGCSSYTVCDGDRIVFSYTCDLGADLGVEVKEDD